jgi:hypothetical protein
MSVRPHNEVVQVTALEPGYQGIAYVRFGILALGGHVCCSVMQPA